MHTQHRQPRGARTQVSTRYWASQLWVGGGWCGGGGGGGDGGGGGVVVICGGGVVKGVEEIVN